MSKEIPDTIEAKSYKAHWQALLDELRAEAWASDKLTIDEKRFLDAMDYLSDEEWEPITCEGEPISETIIKDRGER
jgi:hypothetical protein